MKARTKINLPVIHSRDEAEFLVNQYALLKTNEARAIAEMDAKILAIKDRYAPVLAIYHDQAGTAARVLHAWAITHPSEFAERKSIAFHAGTIGFRTGNPKVELLSRKWTWDAVLKRLIELGSGFIRTKDEVDKDKILSTYASSGICGTELATMGIKVTQDESFYVDPSLTPAPQEPTPTI